MDEHAGSSGVGGSSFILYEADCESSCDSDDESQVLQSSDEDFVDNASVGPGNHLELFQTQQKEAGDLHVSNLKRKLLLSPRSDNSEVEQLSPSFAAITFRPNKRNPLVKRRLFESGEQASSPLSVQHEANCISSPRLQVLTGYCSQSSGKGVGSPSDADTEKKMAASIQKLFRLLFVASFGEVTRVFHSNKTTNQQWVILAAGVSEVLYTASFELLCRQCTFVQTTRRVHETGSLCLYLAVFNAAKSRDTVSKLMSNILNVHEFKLQLQPPKLRGICPALFWYKLSLSQATSTYGVLPEWIQQQTNVSYNVGDAVKFDFGTMVQWAYDHKLTDESKIAYDYARIAGSDSNAKAFLASSNQARLVKDCSTMVKHYLRAEVQALTMSAFIKRRCDQTAGSGSWLGIMNLFKYQGIEPIRFVTALRTWLKGVPKKNCLALIGPPNSGKSMLCNSLISFLGGRVLTFANHHSHFWLAPLSDCRAALIDDATHACWKYFDTYLRNVLDGYPICIDRKHKSAVQMKAPPLLVTTNIDVHSEEKYLYLHSRVTPFYFKEPCPTDENGEPVFSITDADWKHFFERLWGRLDLSEQEDEGEEDECSQRTFTCSARAANGTD
ncbi:E1 [Cervus elaphus papillomavirus 1]|uniref:Replication protein E1 n=1 Tax=Cervus elaphus papillomavirus 1 TaxID=1163699 RepID=I3RWJ7_9PAPI|nr:E1 [Cervus elaphus papillomavirus 1]QIQ60726.1 E1 [Cervus elaphus papillomavirus 1]QIQ60735.1 E1 [Cervus elaphus papillomavirus 1]